MTLRRLSAVTAATVFASGLVAAGASSPGADAAAQVTLTPNPAIAGAPFEGWGTSLAWFAHATGGYPEALRQELLDAVFGQDGLDLNIARYNIGGGNATDVPPYLRPGGAVPGWWNPDLQATDAQGAVTATYADRHRYAAAWNGDDPASYDLDADASQRWWIEALRDRNITWEAFSNSPPYFLTESGYVSGGIGDATAEQLATADMPAFADYLVTVVEHLEKTEGIDIRTLDPFNEPNTSYWSTRLGADGWPTPASRQEGAHIGPARQDAMVQALAARLAEPGTTTDVGISAMDETNSALFVQNWNAWSAASKQQVDQLNVHAYGTSDQLVVRDIAKSSGTRLWMSEVEGDWSGGGGFDPTSMANGLGLASQIVGDLRRLQPAAWVFWQPVEDLYNMQRVENLNWGGVYVDFDCNADGDSLRRLAAGDADPSCRIVTNAKFNTARNFTHYIRPGDRLIPSGDDQTAAAVSSTGDSATLVHVNASSAAETVSIDLSRFGAIAPGATVTPVVTTQSPAGDLTAAALVAGEPVPVDATTRSAVLEVPAQSVTTFLVSGVSGVAADAPAFRDGETVQLRGVASGKALTADAGGVVIRSTATDARTQAWTVRTLAGAGTDRQVVALQSRDGRWLATSPSGGAETRSASLAEAAGDSSLQWIPTTTDGASFSLLSPTTERVLDVNAASTAEGAAMGLWPSNGDGNQSWTLVDVSTPSPTAVTAATPRGTAPQLPAAVAVTYPGGLTRTAAVTWRLQGVDWSAERTVEVTGDGTDAFGTAFTARATVGVGTLTAADATSLTVPAGTSVAAVRAAAPATVPAVIGADPMTYPTAATWDWTGVADTAFAAPGVVTLRGTAASNDPSAPGLPAVLSVIVTPALTADIAPASTPSASYTESGYPVSRTINGDTTDKGWSNWRSGTLNTSDTLTYALASPAAVRSVRIAFYADGGAPSWPAGLRVEHRVAGGAWTSTPTQAVSSSGGAPVIDVALADVTADEIRIVMDARPATHIVVSEVDILAVTASPSGAAGLAALTLDALPIAGFDASRTSYDVSWVGTQFPTLRAVAVDSAATVAVVQPAAGGGTGTVTVTAPDGTVSVSTVRVALAAPVTVTATVSADAPANEAGWFRSPVSVQLSDDADDATAQYRLDPSGEWSAADGPVVVSAEGTTTVQYRAVRGGVAVPGSPGDAVVRIDRTAPTTSVSTDPASGQVADGGRVTATFRAVDAVSGVARTEYSSDGGGSWTAGSEVSFTAVGSYRVLYRSVDAAGNAEPAKAVTLTVSARGTAATVSLTSADPPSPDGWYRQNVIVRLTAPTAGDRLQYRINGGAWRGYSSPLSVSTSGVTTIDHRVLRAGVVVAGSEATVRLQVDKTPPVASATRWPASGTGSPRNPILVELTGSDATSGLDRVEYRIDSGTWTTAGSDPVRVDTVGDHVVSYRALDRAGNTSAAKSVTVVIAPDPATTVKAGAASVRRGAALTLTLAGFVRYDDVTVTVAGQPVASVLTDQSGRARVTVVVPAATPLGAQPVVATGSDGRTSATTSVTVKQ